MNWVQFDASRNSSGDTKILRESLSTGHVVSVRISAPRLRRWRRHGLLGRRMVLVLVHYGRWIRRNAWLRWKWRRMHTVCAWWTLHGHLGVVMRSVRAHHGGRVRIAHHVRRAVHRRISLWGRRPGVWTEGSAVHCRECGGGRRRPYLNALASKNVVEVLLRERGHLSLDKGLALGKLVLESLCVAPGGKCLAVPVLLVALCAGCCARCASWVLGIALYGDRKQ